MAGKYKRTSVTLHSGKQVKVYASPRVYDAFREVTADMNIYKGVRLAQLLEAVYNQGQKDGARLAFDETEKGLLAARDAVPHRPPGRPRKRS